MKTNLSITVILSAIKHFFQRFHVVLFVIFVLGSSSLAILTLQKVIGTSDEANGYQSNANSTSFDQDTIDRLRQLKSDGQTSDKLDLSQTRINPF